MQGGRVDIDANMGIWHEHLVPDQRQWLEHHTRYAYNTLGSHEVYPPLNNRFVKLHAKLVLTTLESVNGYHLLGDPIHQKATHPVITIVYSHEMTSLVQLVSAGEACRARSNNGDLLACTERWRVGDNPTHLETLDRKAQRPSKQSLVRVASPCR